MHIQATTVLDTRREPLTEAELAGLAITMEDFDSAISKVQPSVRREGFATTPDVTWEDVGALEEVSLIYIHFESRASGTRKSGEKVHNFGSQKTFFH